MKKLKKKANNAYIRDQNAHILSKLKVSKAEAYMAEVMRIF